MEFRSTLRGPHTERDQFVLVGIHVGPDQMRRRNDLRIRPLTADKRPYAGSSRATACADDFPEQRNALLRPTRGAELATSGSYRRWGWRRSFPPTKERHEP